jgi:DNA (cytosine-5)-methyltransferase 1
VKLLDLFCGAGGCSVGYSRAGFTDIVGVDVKPMPRYPFTFVQGDALEYLAAHGHEFDAIHASPPCQCYTALRSVCGNKEYPDLVAPTRAALEATGKPWVIENVPGAPLNNPIRLCGAMFPGLRVYRHRLFESSHAITAPVHPDHVIRSTGTQRGRKSHYEAGGFITITGDVGTYCGGAMEIDWMNGNELSQAIPPAYTEFIGKQLVAHLESRTVPA